MDELLDQKKDVQLYIYTNNNDVTKGRKQGNILVVWSFEVSEFASFSDISWVYMLEILFCWFYEFFWFPF